MIFQLLGISKGEVLVELAAASLVPGMRVPGRALFRAGDQPRAVRWFRVVLQMVSSTPRPGPMGLEMVRDARHVLPPIELSGPFQIAAGQQAEFRFELQLPAVMLPTIPGHLEYELWANAHVEGDLIDCAQMLRVLVTPPHAAPPGWASPWQHAQPYPAQPYAQPYPQQPYPPQPYAAAQAAWAAAPAQGQQSPAAQPSANPPVRAAPAAPGLPAQGSTVRARSHEGQWAEAMVVQHLGALVLVQWHDGRPATWVRAEQLEPLPPPAAASAAQLPAAAPAAPPPVAPVAAAPAPEAPAPPTPVAPAVLPEAAPVTRLGPADAPVWPPADTAPPGGGSPSGSKPGA